PQAMEEGVDPEPAHAVQLEREVEIVGGFEFRLLLVGEDVVDQGVDLLAAELGHVEPGELAVDPQRRPGPGGEMQVGGVQPLGLDEQIGNIHRVASGPRDRASERSGHCGVTSGRTCRTYGWTAID